MDVESLVAGWARGDERKARVVWLVLGHGLSVAAAAREVGVRRDTAWKWVRACRLATRVGHAPRVLRGT